ncbi:MAG: diguanylate cyclase [Tepidanaerobacteraceae bacterium]|jgi:diguanylate cyclase (GGDEF)-like protein/PAS domain S-box-containing protein|nr:diguanylate cyclase [Tepidanaerobacteraceae bacterium]
MDNTAFSIYDLFVFYEIASLSYLQGFDEFMEEIVEKSTRLFGTRRLAIVLLSESKEKKEYYFGFKNKINLEEMLAIKPENCFVYYFDGGKLGFIYFENDCKISLRSNKMYNIFSKRIEELIKAKFMEQAIKENEEKFKNIFLQSPLGIEIYDKNGRLLEVNRACLDIFGIVNPDELKGFRLFEDPNLPEVQKQKLLGGEAIRYESEFDFDIVKSKKLYNTTKSGKMHIDCSITPLKVNSDICGHIVIVQDITERKRNEEKIRYLTFHDNVTGLYNRHYFEEEIRRLDAERQVPLSIIIGDLNGLKLLNDAFGHFQGDELLKKIADILRKACRKEDIIARWGGDEFAILLPRTDKKTAEQICMRITNLCMEGEVRIPLSIALGCSTKENHLEDINEALNRAEDAMYRQKSMEGSEVRKRLLSALKRTLLENTDETEEHIDRIKNIALKMAEKLGLSEEQLNSVKLLAEFHDIGKVAVPEDLFRKGKSPTPDEIVLMQKHVETGYRIAISFPELSGISEEILHHHERWDGRGYPKGLKGEEISLLARIISIADSYDELIQGMSHEDNPDCTKVLKEIKRNSGIKFDPSLVDLLHTILVL